MNKKRKNSSQHSSKTKKKYDNFKMSIDDEELKTNIKDFIRSDDMILEENGASIYKEPFRCFVLKDFVKDEEFVEELHDDLLKLDFNSKSTDLFQFQQSEDLTTCKVSSIATLRNKLFTDTRLWLEDLLDITLNDTIDISCAKYQHTDHLLCHDDELEGRMIAFIYYLVPRDWNNQDGGCLDLFSTNKQYHPMHIERSILPSYNSFLFFEVTPQSFHQVAEILSTTKTRLSLSGWFHGKSAERENKYPLPKEIMNIAKDQEDDILISWINHNYLNPDIVSDIQEQFEENSEIQLTNFLQKDKYNAVLSELQNENTKWTFEGPYHQKCCRRLNEKTLSQSTILKELVTLISSKPFFKLLKKLTDLNLCNLDENEDESASGSTSNDQSSSNDQSVNDTHETARCCSNIREWKQGCYSLLHDDDVTDYSLDAFLHFHNEDWENDVDDVGGIVSYVSTDDVDEEEILRVEPITNCLSLVYREASTSSFTRYINSKAAKKLYYCVDARYVEK